MVMRKVEHDTMPHGFRDVVEHPRRGAYTRSLHVCGSKGIWGTVLAIDPSTDYLHIEVERDYEVLDENGDLITVHEGYSVYRPWTDVVELRVDVVR